jgi:MerR family transcriptional regulator/heat shock protein HspR
MTNDEILDYDEPAFVISVAARMLGVRTQTLRYYERQGLINPQRTPGRQRIFSRRDVDRLRRIRLYMDDWGMNLAGVEVVLKLMERVQRAEAEVERLAAENDRLRSELNAARLSSS